MKATALRVPHILILSALLAAACSDSSGPGKPGAPTNLAVAAGSPQEGTAGDPLATEISVKVTDDRGRGVPRVAVTFAVLAGGGTLSASVDSTDNSGLASVAWTMGASLGAAQAEARVTGITASAVFNATVKAGPPTALQLLSGTIGNSAAGFDVLDSVAVRVTDRFNNPIAGSQVTFTVIEGGGSTSNATRATDADGVARTAWTIGPAGSQKLLASAGALEGLISANAVTCAEQQLAVGEVLSVVPGTPNCVVLTDGGQKFLVSVANTRRFPFSAIGFRFRGAAGQSANLAATLPATGALQTADAFLSTRLVQEQAETRSHGKLMSAAGDLLGRLGPGRRAVRNRTPSLRLTAALPAVGEVLPIRIPLDFGNICSLASSAQIGGRVAYVGTRSIVVEDTLAPLRGENDVMLRAIGEEFDQVMWPILTENYGNALALDAELDANERVIMVFSPRVNTMLGGSVAGFVSPSDFFTPAEGCPASNVGEYFYARVPTRAGGGFDTDNTTLTVDEWLHAFRTVIIHEVTHIASFAEKLANPAIEGTPSDFFDRNAWLEEATAMVAEELWARTVFGYSFRGNVNYASSLSCEVHARSGGSCAGKPKSLLDHFFFLSLFAEATEIQSPIGDPYSDFSVYGSGWLFVRWLLDQYAASEGPVLRAITSEVIRPGVESVEAHFNRPFAQLITDWSLALALDDYPGINLADQHQILSWNLRDIYSKLNTDLPNAFPRAYPLKVRTAGLGKFLVDVSAVRGGTLSTAEVSGTASARQLFEFKGLFGTEFPAEMRISIVRLQ